MSLQSKILIKARNKKELVKALKDIIMEIEETDTESISIMDNDISYDAGLVPFAYQLEVDKLEER